MILHLGCGLDSRNLRWESPAQMWCDVGVTQVYGMDTPSYLAESSGLIYSGEAEMAPEALICQLIKGEQQMLHNLCSGRIAGQMY